MAKRKELRRTSLYSNKRLIWRSSFSIFIRFSYRNIGFEHQQRNRIKKYAEENNIDLDEIAVIGDSGNDISMFEITKNSFAMSRAPKFVKEKANYIVDRVYNMEEYIDKL